MTLSPVSFRLLPRLLSRLLFRPSYRPVLEEETQKSDGKRAATGVVYPRDDCSLHESVSALPTGGNVQFDQKQRLLACLGAGCLVGKGAVERLSLDAPYCQRQVQQREAAVPSLEVVSRRVWCLYPPRHWTAASPEREVGRFRGRFETKGNNVTWIRDSPLAT